MSFESDLLAVLKTAAPALGSRVFPDFAPTTTQRPYCTFQGIGGKVLNPIGGSIPTSRNSEVQINVWSNTRAEALSIIRAIEDAMRGASAFVAQPVSAARWDFDADIPVYCALQDFTCWHDA